MWREECNNLLRVVSLAGDKRQQCFLGNVNGMNILQWLDTALALSGTTPSPCCLSQGQAVAAMAQEISVGFPS